MPQMPIHLNTSLRIAHTIDISLTTETETITNPRHKQDNQIDRLIEALASFTKIVSNNGPELQ